MTCLLFHASLSFKPCVANNQRDPWQQYSMNILVEWVCLKYSDVYHHEPLHIEYYSGEKINLSRTEN